MAASASQAWQNQISKIEKAWRALLNQALTKCLSPLTFTPSSAGRLPGGGYDLLGRGSAALCKLIWTDASSLGRIRQYVRGAGGNAVFFSSNNFGTAPNAAAAFYPVSLYIAEMVVPLTLLSYRHQ